VLLCAVALVVAAFALITWRRRRATPASTRAPRGGSAAEPVSGRPPTEERRTASTTADRHGARRVPSRSPTGRHSQKPDPRRSTVRRRGRAPAGTTRNGANGDGDRLVGVAAKGGRPTRSQRLESSRTKHPSAAVALAHARPKETAAGWYEDPSDGEGRRIRYWDGTSWTAHVAEPEG
jgi:hypothetical protein